nr:MAG: putative RNA-dependent RNA polymerase [Picobirnavirus sp.]
MKETKLQQHELDIVQANAGMDLYLRGLSAGKSFTPRSSLYNIKGKTEMLEPDEILERWKTKLQRLSIGSEYEQKVFQFDFRQLEKWGPQGGVAPIDELLEEIVIPTFSGDTHPSAFSSDELWQEAKQIVTRTLMRSGARSLRPAPYQRVVDDMRARDTLESNSGWPLFTRRNKPEVIKQSIQEAEDGLWKIYPAIALFRNYNNKTRLVWMFPMSTNLVEGSFFQPLQSVLMNGPLGKTFLAPWTGFETVRQRITDAYASNMAIAASDFSSTDAHFQLSTTMEVFDVISPCFQPQYRSALKESLIHMHTIPLLIGVDEKIEGEHGVSSGSNWTNFIETIFDMILSVWVRLREQKLLSRSGKGEVYTGLYAIGDDMSWCVDKRHFDADFAKRLEAYGEAVGQQVRADKTTNNPDDVKSLQRLFQRGYLREDMQVRAVYPTIRALKSLVWPERSHKKRLWSRDMAAMRAIMILENTVDHPYFSEFVHFVAEGDPHLVEFAHYSATKQRMIARKSKLVPGLNPTYNQERRDSDITTFKTVQLLATL